ncbi:MAG: hypothetical protein KJ955_04170 [Nanoarchaeota archaeon]|nr:hypothetical protein [Nanoarchaeota archaeon]
MIAEEHFLNELRHYFKLNLYEARVWTALLSRGISNAGELAEISDVPRSRTYDILEGLEKRGFVMLRSGKPIKYIAISPKEVVDRVKKNLQIEAMEHSKKLDSSKGAEIVKELELLHKHGVEFVESSDLSTAIKGRHNAYLHMETMLKNAASSVLIVASAKGIARKAETLGPMLKEISKKGVKVRIAAPVTKESADALKELAAFAEVRHLQKPNSRFCIVDNKEVMFMLMNDSDVHPTYDTGVWVNTPFFAATVGNLFDMAWKDMEPADKYLKKF